MYELLLHICVITKVKLEPERYSIVCMCVNIRLLWLTIHGDVAGGDADAAAAAGSDALPFALIWPLRRRHLHQVPAGTVLQHMVPAPTNTSL